MHGSIRLKTVCLNLILAMLTIAVPAHAYDLGKQLKSNIYGTAYKSIGQCGDFPRVSAPTPKWACVGIVAGPQHGLKMPREVLPLKDGSILVTDMVGWKRAGKLWRLTRDVNGKYKAHAIFTGLKHPSGLRMGPDGMVYIGEEHRIWSFDPNNPKLKKTTVVTGLPRKIRPGKPDHYHPISYFVFDGVGDILLNLGSYDDRCERRVAVKGKRTRKFPTPCPSDKASNMEAGVWKITRIKTTGKWSAPERYARGLRNSIAMAVHPETGTILQAENNVDRWGGTIHSPINPPEEFNVIVKGKHYGWPYCIGMNRALPEYQRRVRCNAAKFEPPISLLPAHSSPFGMAYYQGALFPELKGKLILALHGWQPNGHRIAIFDTDAQGHPIKAKGQKIDQFLIGNWKAKTRLRPRGRPGGLMVDGDGGIWFTDYKNHTVMVIQRTGE